MKFKVGDKVKIRDSDNNWSASSKTYKGRIGVISDIYPFKYDFQGEQTDGYYYLQIENNSKIDVWERDLVDNKQTNMQKLNSMLKRLLDKDSQALYKAGFIDGDLKLTSRGQEELNGIVFEANKTELVRLAQEQIVEDKEDK